MVSISKNKTNELHYWYLGIVMLPETEVMDPIYRNGIIQIDRNVCIYTTLKIHMQVCNVALA